MELALEEPVKDRQSKLTASDAGSKAGHNPKSKRKVRMIAAAGVFALGVAIAAFYTYYGGRETTDDAQVDAHVAPIAAKVSGNIVQVLVDDNQRVKAGQVLLRIDPRDYQVRVDQARAALSKAENEAESASITVPFTDQTTNIGTHSAGAELAGAEAAYAKAKTDYERYSTSEVAYARANIQATSSARSAVQQARANLDAAGLQLSYTTVVAPIDGLVSGKSIQVGQIVKAGQPMLTIVPLQHVWVTANFKETQLAHVRQGQKAEVSVDMYGRTFSAHVDSIAGASGAELSLLPPENATGNFVKVVQRVPVKLVIDNIPKQFVMRPGMNVVATIFTK